MANVALNPQPNLAAMANAALSPQPEFAVMAAGCEETANTFTLVIRTRNCQNLPTLRGYNEIVTLLRRIIERLDRIIERLDRMEERLDRGFRRVEVHQLNNQARLENSYNIAGNVAEDLTPLYSSTAANAQLQVIPHFPSRIEDINQLDTRQVNDLLRHLEQSTGGSLAQRRSRLKRAVGGFIRYNTSAV
ncbi:hypothetical protein BU26DRAFT_525174 [Trematosphaeria pertusa]|uniref:Uncharacterized protein n=1 Tax=Trematosphaeria pertusa TaxID=390896 RepID=A0A6A6HT91_9PLEO|nr:uncharacterized protein BU26DRAFT_525174 [Trematosphaeria pertusa]KAF2241336.1 hypothetical protein BU26DRAFT_525174 [Trematosphaeria pertusa]